MKERAEKTLPKQVYPAILALRDLHPAMYNRRFTLQERRYFPPARSVAIPQQFNAII